MKCAECGTRCEDEFRYRDHILCCACMEVLVSWFMDGGFVEESEAFAHLGATVGPS